MSGLKQRLPVLFLFGLIGGERKCKIRSSFIAILIHFKYFLLITLCTTVYFNQTGWIFCIYLN